MMTFASQKPEGWVPMPDRYDDGGFLARRWNDRRSGDF
jgi:hypothetical protein